MQYRGIGPVMRVVAASGNLCYCRWVDEGGAVQHGTFDNANLRPGAQDSNPTPLSEL